MKDLIKYKEALDILKVSPTTFYKYVRLGILPQPYLVCGVKQWERSGIMDYLESCKPSK